MLPGKKTKNTLACVFAGANVLGRRGRDHRPVYIVINYRAYIMRSINGMEQKSARLDL